MPYTSHAFYYFEYIHPDLALRLPHANIKPGFLNPKRLFNAGGYYRKVSYDHYFGSNPRSS